METSMISTRTVSSMITKSIAMIDVECPPLPEGVDHTSLEAHREGHDRDVPTSSRVHVSGPECFSRAIRAAVIPPNFRLATGVSKLTGESKPDTWLEDYRVAVQIGGGNDEVAMKHLPLMLEGSARAWLNQLAPGSIFS